MNIDLISSAFQKVVEFNYVDLTGRESIVLREDKYPDGSSCYVAEHPAIDGCVAYADTVPEALARLKAVRAAITQDVPRPEGLFQSTPTPRSVPVFSVEQLAIPA